MPSLQTNGLESFIGYLAADYREAAPNDVVNEIFEEQLTQAADQGDFNKLEELLKLDEMTALDVHKRNDFCVKVIIVAYIMKTEEGFSFLNMFFQEHKELFDFSDYSVRGQFLYLIRFFPEKLSIESLSFLINGIIDKPSNVVEEATALVNMLYAAFLNGENILQEGQISRGKWQGFTEEFLRSVDGKELTWREENIISRLNYLNNVNEN